MRTTSRALVLVLLGGAVTAQAVSALPFENDAERTIYRTMMRRLTGSLVSVSWEDVALRDAIKEVGRLARVPIVLSTALGDDAEAPVSMTVSDVPAISVLRLLGESLRVAVQFRHGVMVATTRDDALKQAMVLRIYDIREITYVPPDFPPPVQLGIRPGPIAEPQPEPERREGVDPDFIVDLVRQATGGEAWDLEGASILAHNGKLFVRHAPAMQARVSRLLDRLRGAF